MRHVSRHHKVDIGSIHETLEDPKLDLEYIEFAKQAADIFTKELGPQKWQPALDLLHIRCDMADFPPAGISPTGVILAGDGPSVRGQIDGHHTGILAACTAMDDVVARSGQEDGATAAQELERMAGDIAKRCHAAVSTGPALK